MAFSRARNVKVAQIAPVPNSPVSPYCIENKVRGWAAISAGICPSVKDPRTINKRLDGLIVPSKSLREDLRIG